VPRLITRSYCSPKLEACNRLFNVATPSFIPAQCAVTISNRFHLQLPTGKGVGRGVCRPVGKRIPISTFFFYLIKYVIVPRIEIWVPQKFDYVITYFAYVKLPKQARSGYQGRLKNAAVPRKGKKPSFTKKKVLKAF
jgi:hypothetical protein